MDPGALFKPFTPPAALLNALQCNVCFEPYGASPPPNPVERRAMMSTACGHTFCDQCVASLLEKNFKKCSICNAEVNFRTGFQRNFQLEEQHAATSEFLATVQENVRSFLDEPSMVEVIAAEAQRIKEERIKSYNILLAYCYAAATNGLFSYDFLPLAYTPMTLRFIKMELNSQGLTLLEKTGDVVTIHWCDATEGEAAKLKTATNSAIQERERIACDNRIKAKVEEIIDSCQETARDGGLERYRQFYGLGNGGIDKVLSILDEEGFYAYNCSYLLFFVSWEGAIKGEAFKCKKLVSISGLGHTDNYIDGSINLAAIKLYRELVYKAWDRIEEDPSANWVAINTTGIDMKVVDALERKCVKIGGFNVHREVNMDTSSSEKINPKFEIQWFSWSEGAAGLIEGTRHRLLAARNADA